MLSIEPQSHPKAKGGRHEQTRMEEQGLGCRFAVRNGANWPICADFQNTAQLRRHGRRVPLGAGPGHRRELVRDNIVWRGQQRWHGLQNQPQWWPGEDPLQLLLAGRNRLHGWVYAHIGAGPGPRWELLRDSAVWRGQLAVLGLCARLWGGLQNHPQWHADAALQLLLTGWSQLHGRQLPLRGAG